MKRSSFFTAFIFWMFSLVAFAYGATVSGKVTLISGDKPAKQIDYAVIYLLPEDEATRYVLSDTQKFPPVTQWMNQKDKEFIPRVVPVQKGAKVRFGNADPWFHNVYSRQPEFSLGRYPKGFFKEQTFDAIGVAHIFCDIHLNMHALVFAVDTPLFTTADSDGHFKIENVPPGIYTLNVWQERSGTESLSLNVGDDDRSDLRILLLEKDKKAVNRDLPGSIYSRSLLR